MINPYYSHRPHLIKLLDSLDYTKSVTCIEFGVGYGSSEIFNEYCLKYPNLTTYAYETDRVWYDEIALKFQNKNYIFQHLDNWDILDYDALPSVDVSFIDQSPWEARIKSLDNMAFKSQHILIHDYDYFNKGIVDDIFDVSEKSFLGKYINHFNIHAYYKELPPTVILSVI